MASKRATIRDVAQATGLAHSTISNALRGRAYVSKQTRDLVVEAAAKLGYRASTTATALRTGRSNVVGVLVSDIVNPGIPDIVGGVEDEVARNGYTILVCSTGEDEQRQVAQMRALIDRGVDGMVLISQRAASPEILELLSYLPCALIQRRDSQGKYDYVGSDNRNAIVEAVSHLSELGHKRVGYVRGPLDSSSAAERVQTFKTECRRRNIDATDMIFVGDYSMATGNKAAEYFLTFDEPPTAIMGSCDVNALGIIQTLEASGIRIPEQISVVGFDDIELASLHRINLTTIHQDRRLMGVEAARLLLRRMEANRARRREIVTPTRLIVRGTTAPPRKVARLRARSA